MSEIKLKEIKCPVCAAPLKLKDEGYGQTTCEYCGAIIYADREDTSPTGEITVYDEMSNRPIATLNIPIGWNVAHTFINYDKSTLRIPYNVGLDIENNMGSIIHIETGNSYEMFGGAGLAGVTQSPHTMQKDFETVDQYLDDYIAEFGRMIQKKIKFKENMDIPVEGYNREKDFHNFQMEAEQDARKNEALIGQRTNISGIYCDSACRVYETEDDRVIVAYTKEYGHMLSLAGFGGIGNSMNSLMQGLNGFMGNMGNNNGGGLLNQMADSGLLGGMLGKKFKSQPNQQPQPTQPMTEPPVQEVKENPIYQGQITNPGIGQAYMWMSDPVFILITSKDEYKDVVEKAFKQICSSFALSREVQMEHQQLRMEWEQQNQMGMNQTAQMKYQQGQNLVRLGEQRMAANHAYINSMMDRSNKQYQSQRDSYNSRMAAQDRMRDARSEAIRGVNTYIKPDGKEVEVPVSADTAWINGKGEIVGGGAGFNPGSGWTQMERK